MGSPPHRWVVSDARICCDGGGRADRWEDVIGGMPWPTPRTRTPTAGLLTRDAGQGLADDDELKQVDRWWRAANYLSVGQIYLRANPLLRRPLTAEDTKSRLLGHWGTTPGLNFVYAHLNRVIRRDSREMLVARQGAGK